MFGFRHSIFLRLLGFYSLTFLCLSVGLVAINFGILGDERSDFFRINLHHYAELMADEIGYPPDPVKADALSRELNLNLGWYGPQQEWASSPEFLKKIQAIRADSQANLYPEGKILAHRSLQRIEKPPFTYFLSGKKLSEFSGLGLALRICLLAAVLVISYLLVSRALAPIKDMKELALAFGNGQWKSRVKVRGKDELADLARTMNDMGDRIEGYIASMQGLMIAISHELRSPLTRMKLALEFVNEPRIKASLNEEITLLDRMTEALLERERVTHHPELLRLEPTDLHAFVKSIAAAYTTLDLSLGQENRLLSLDPPRMAMALRNLIENAIRHGDGRPEVLTAADGSYLEVRDAGPGIPPAEIPRLGEAFFVMDKARSSGGFGLGISLTYAIVKAHGFRIDAKNREPHGMVFRISFDAASGHALS